MLDCRYHPGSAGAGNSFRTAAGCLNTEQELVRKGERLHMYGKIYDRVPLTMHPGFISKVASGRQYGVNAANKLGRELEMTHTEGANAHT